jgi:hypothetical protein
MEDELDDVMLKLCHNGGVWALNVVDLGFDTRSSFYRSLFLNIIDVYTS